MSTTDWIEHDGKGMPVNPETRVIYQMRNEVRELVETHYGNGVRAETLRWKISGSGDDIIAYRVVSK